MFSAFQSTCGPLTEGENSVQIDGDAHAILPQNGTKLTKKRGSKFGALLWRHLTPQRKTAKKGAQLQSLLYTTVQKRFWIIYFLYEFWCAQTCSF